MATVTDRKSDAVQSSGVVHVNRRKSIKESEFAVQYADLLKPIYKYYQAMQFSTYGAHFQWESNHRKRCVQMLLDAAKECHNNTDYICFKKAVQAELIGDHAAPRYHPLFILGSYMACQCLLIPL